jgi:hypothetical protein
MKLKTSLSLVLAGACLSPSTVYAAPRKPAPVAIEYCTMRRNSIENLTISRADGTEANVRGTTAPAQLTKMARYGWRVVACAGTGFQLVWTLERRR